MRWYQSLYWRIALGVVAFLAAMLVVQAVLFVWAVSQSGRSAPGQSPGRLGTAVALDLAAALERDPEIDLDTYVREQYQRYEHPFFVMLPGGRVITSGSATFPEPLLRLARARLEAREPMGPRPDGFGPRERPGGPRPGGPRANRLGRPWPGAGPGGPGAGGRAVVPIYVADRLAGVVVVPSQAPFGFLLWRYAPVLTLVAGAVLLVGAVLTSLMIFGPARRRLKGLEQAARALGGGDLSARAPDRGGDEIAEVARAFNGMAADLAARAEALTTSDRLRRQLLADVSHELNTPVTAMRGYIETLSMPELQLDAETRARYLAIVGDETRRLEQLIGDLLDLARLEGGGGPLRLESVPVAPLFARVTARHERSAADAGVALDASIGPGAESALADRDRLEQALQNLAANAVRHAPHGTTVRLAARAAGDAVVLSVSDEGAGIAPEHLPHVFDRFYKVDTARAGVSGGSGLGLSIVKAIVERHGGRVTAESRPGRTVFEVTLPTRPTSSRPATP